MAYFDGPVLASHNNCRALVPGDRQFTDDQIRKIIERDGVIGSAWMLYPGWTKGETFNTVVSLKTVADHMDHVCQLTGNARHVAIDTDLDGGYGYEQTPPMIWKQSLTCKNSQICCANGDTTRKIYAISCTATDCGYCMMLEQERSPSPPPSSFSLPHLFAGQSTCPACSPLIQANEKLGRLMEELPRIELLSS